MIHVHRSRTPGFTMIPNEVLRDPGLSLRARGLLVQLLSHEDGWQQSVAYAQRECGDGRDSIKSGLRELEEAGYLTRVRRHAQDGKWVWDHNVTDAPKRADSPSMANPSTAAPSTVMASIEVEPLGEEPLDEEPQDQNLALATRTRRPDELFELLVFAEVQKPYSPDLHLTKNLRARINAAAGQAREAGYTVADLTEAAAGWRGAMGDSRITANGLVTNALRCINAYHGASFTANGSDSYQRLVQALEGVS